MDTAGARSSDDSLLPGGAWWENALEMLAVASQDGFLVEVNPSWERILGYSCDELTSRPYLDFVHPDDVEATVVEATKLQVAGQTLVNFENRYRARDGGYRWLSWTVWPTADGAHLNCVTRNITEQKDAEERSAALTRELAVSERRYRLLAENATDVVWEMTADETIGWVSPSVESVLGWQVEELIGRDPRELVHPEDTVLIGDRRTIAFSGHKVDQFELRVRTSAGNYRWMSAQSRSVMDSEGRLQAVVVGLRDVDEQMRTRRALASERMFRLAMDAAPQGMAVETPDRMFREVNQALCELLGYDERWLLSHGVADILHDDDKASDLGAPGADRREVSAAGG